MCIEVGETSSEVEFKFFLRLFFVFESMLFARVSSPTYDIIMYHNVVVQLYILAHITFWESVIIVIVAVCVLSSRVVDILQMTQNENDSRSCPRPVSYIVYVCIMYVRTRTVYFGFRAIIFWNFYELIRANNVFFFFLFSESTVQYVL